IIHPTSEILQIANSRPASAGRQSARGQLLGWHTLVVSLTQQLGQNETLILETSLDLLSAPAHDSAGMCHSKNFRRASSGGEAMARRRTEERRAGIAS